MWGATGLLRQSQLVRTRTWPESHYAMDNNDIQLVTRHVNEYLSKESAQITWGMVELPYRIDNAWPSGEGQRSTPLEGSEGGQALEPRFRNEGHGLGSTNDTMRSSVGCMCPRRGNIGRNIHLRCSSQKTKFWQEDFDVYQCQMASCP